MPTAAMLVIGDEILSGRTRDSNAHHLAGRLSERGIRLIEIRVVPDRAAAIVRALRALSGEADHLFTSGGIGPTHDDITADAVAEAFGVSIGVREDARAILAAHYGGELNEARLRMARIPDGATLIDNPLSRAPGFSLRNVHVMAGVPEIFEVMVAGLLPKLAGGAPMLTRSFRLRVPEGDVAGPLRRLAEANPDVAIGCYPSFRSGPTITVILRCEDPVALGRAADATRTALAAIAPELEEDPPTG